MKARIGPLLSDALATPTFVAELDATRTRALSVDGDQSAHVADPDDLPLSIVIKLPTRPPEPGQDWKHYADWMGSRLYETAVHVGKSTGIEPQPLVAANSLQADASRKQILELQRDDAIEVELIELDPILQVTQMDDVAEDIDLPALRIEHPTLDGTRVRVAVLDSGIDTHHPYLSVDDSISTNWEPVAIPGSHGTHCAGSIASTDETFRGVAPGASLLNIKVLASNGTGKHTDIVRGIDEALAREAHVISMSLGFNHLPGWSDGGHGWACASGDCPLCTAVDNATLLDDPNVIVVAAGNEHERAEALRNQGKGSEFDTELGCPGQARGALTVGAIAKRTFSPAPFSSHGPTSYGNPKPDLCAPGVNITSTVPVPRDAGGSPRPSPGRALLFGRKSGTSMATPIVAGACALVVQKLLNEGGALESKKLRDIVFGRLIASLQSPENVAGAGRITLKEL